jgi:phage gpG-like protein
MAVEIDITWAGRSASDYSRVFAVAATVDDFRPAFDEIAKKVIAPSVRANFDQGGRPAWAKLAPSTIERKSALGLPFPHKVLVATGAMQEAATDPGTYKITKDELRAGPFGIDYWLYHQAGTTSMPQRVIMMLQAQDRSQITRILGNYFRQFLVFDPRQAGARVFRGFF